MKRLRCPSTPVKIIDGAPKGLGPLTGPIDLSIGDAAPALGKIVCQDGSERPCSTTPSARIFVGLSRGVSKGKCATAKESYTVDEVDAFVLGQRVAQVGKDAALTRYSAQGVYKKEPEDTSVFEVFPAAGEKPKVFAQRVRDTAEFTGKKFCQESIYIESIDAKGVRVVEQAKAFEGGAGTKKGRTGP